MSAFTAQQLGPERARALGELPLSVMVDGVLFCHATPRRDEELVTRSRRPSARRRCSPTWTPRWSSPGIPTSRTTAWWWPALVNAGSVGLPYEGDSDARWLWIEDGVPERRRTAYDAAAAGRRMRDACEALTDSVNASLIEPVEAVVVTRMFEERAGQATVRS